MIKENKIKRGFWKGKKFSEEHKKKIREARKGVKHTEETRKKIGLSNKGWWTEERRKKMSILAKEKGFGKWMKGRPSPTLGRHHTEEARMKIRKATMGEKNHNYGKHPSEELIMKNRIAQLGRHQEKTAGKNHWNWKGGTTKLIEKIKKSFTYRQWRSDVFTRDNFTCQECNQVSGRLNPHHIKQFSKIIRENKIKTLKDAMYCDELWNINNGETLCDDCHKKTESYGHWNRER